MISAQQIGCLILLAVVGSLCTRTCAADPSTDESEFISLFDGRTLEGWQGAVDDYHVENDTVVYVPGSGKNLFTVKEYDNFVLRFCFMLTLGANSGLAIRAPLQGEPAYEGIELQISDDGAPKYKELKPYQYHGSV